MDIRNIIEHIRQENPSNIMADTLDLRALENLPETDREIVISIIRSGLDNPESQVGAYAMNPTDYSQYNWVLGPIIRKYHSVEEDFRQREDWDLEGDFDLRALDPSLEGVSMRVRVARNTVDFPLPGSMTKEQRVGFEDYMVKAFQQLISDQEFGGRYVSLTPGSSYEISKAEYEKLVADHKMFKDMGEDPYLNSAGISGDWPYGRGMYESENGQLIIWVNEEDQLRIVSMAVGSDLSLVFRNLRKLLSKVESSGVTFAVSDQYGNVTSCPSNIGTGMRASIHIPLPNLVKDEAKLKDIARMHKLSVRGLGGEHTAYGADGMVDISPRARLGVTEAEILRALYSGIKQMLEEERK